MTSDKEWSIVFYTDENGASPIREFLESLDIKTQARFIWSIEQLRLRNVQARGPLVRHLEGKLWELREESHTDIFRLLYFFFTGRRIVFIHGFQKKTQKTPRRELEIAQKRLEQWIEREETQ
jgi:phage-related protein